MTEWKLSNRRGDGRNLAWLKAHVDYRRGDCLKYPFGLNTDGYGQLGHEGKVRKAHRVMCELAHGPAPSPDHEAAHSCGRGHQGCINPRHLSWKTRSGNQRDRRKHGTHGNGNKDGPRHKLTEIEVGDIRRRVATETRLSLAKEFDVTVSMITKIKNGTNWADGRTRRFSALSDDQVRNIRSKFGSGTMKAIAQEIGVSEAVVSRIKYGRSYRYVS